MWIAPMGITVCLALVIFVRRGRIARTECLPLRSALRPLTTLCKACIHPRIVCPVLLATFANRMELVFFSININASLAIIVLNGLLNKLPVRLPHTALLRS